MDRLVAELNNMGVSYLAEGDLRTALDLFRDALRGTMGEMPHSNLSIIQASRHLPAHHEKVSTTSRMMMMEAPPASLDQYDVDQAAANASSSHNEGSCYPQQEMMEISDDPAGGIAFVHGQGFTISAESGAYSPHPLVNSAVISTIVIFNLACVYHLKGLREKAVNESRLRKAFSLYSKANLLLADAGAITRSTGNAIVDMISMSIANNLAQVSFELTNYQESRQHFERLIRFALTVVPTAYGEGPIGSVVEKQKSNFLLNAIILHAPTLAAAA